MLYYNKFISISKYGKRDFLHTLFATIPYWLRGMSVFKGISLLARSEKSSALDTQTFEKV